MGKYFGTDGVRATAGEFPLDRETVEIIGASLARNFAERHGRPPKFLTGRDTRESGEWIETALHSGAAAEGAIVASAGVITTPGVAFLTRAEGMDAGIVISASHNPFEDNGLKVFLPSGRKLDEATEQAIEADIDNGPIRSYSTHEADRSQCEKFVGDYLAHLRSAEGGVSLAGKRLVIDCANGAASNLAPDLFSSLGADVTAINAMPDGRNINFNCGSLHLDGLRKKVVELAADIGIAFDGDADRALFVDETGAVIDGDATLWIMARELKTRNALKGSAVVATVMSNIGLEIALRSEGIELLRTAVGDKYVLEELLSGGYSLGGEQSGHIIFPSLSLVGDGMMTALLLLKAVATSGLTLSQAAAGFERYPQVLVNINVAKKVPFDEVPEISEAAQQIERELHGEGRLLLRYSGTEKLARVMIEGRDRASIDEQAERLAQAIRATLG